MFFLFSVNFKGIIINYHLNFTLDFIEPLMLDDATAENQAKVVTPYPYEKIPKKLSNTLANINTKGMFEDDIALAYARKGFLNNPFLQGIPK